MSHSVVVISYWGFLRRLSPGSLGLPAAPGTEAPSQASQQVWPSSFRCCAHWAGGLGGKCLSQGSGQHL